MLIITVSPTAHKTIQIYCIIALIIKLAYLNAHLAPIFMFFSVNHVLPTVQHALELQPIVPCVLKGSIFKMECAQLHALLIIDPISIGSAFTADPPAANL